MILMGLLSAILAAIFNGFSFASDVSTYGSPPLSFHGGYFNGKFTGKCGADGFYYQDSTSFVQCSNGNAYAQKCAPGSRNSGYSKFQNGKRYNAADFCDINLVNYGYRDSRDDNIKLVNYEFKNVDDDVEIFGYKISDPKDNGYYGNNERDEHVYSGYSYPTGYKDTNDNSPKYGYDDPDDISYSGYYDKDDNGYHGYSDKDDTGYHDYDDKDDTGYHGYDDPDDIGYYGYNDPDVNKKKDPDHNGNDLGVNQDSDHYDLDLGHIVHGIKQGQSLYGTHGQDPYGHSPYGYGAYGYTGAYGVYDAPHVYAFTSYGAYGSHHGISNYYGASKYHRQLYNYDDGKHTGTGTTKYYK